MEIPSMFKVLLTSILLMFPVLASAATDVEFLLDLSGSMMKRIDGVPQIDLAKKSFREALKVIPANELVAVRVFAHRIEQSNKLGSCQDTELIYPFAAVNLESIEKVLGKLEPKGYTPLAYGLEKSGEDLITVGKEREPERVIVVLSDGEETCGGDPIAVLKALKDKGVKVVVHTIGFNVEDIARKQLQEIAAFSGGKYFDAKDGVRLSESLQLATKEAFVPIPTPTNTPETRLEKPRELFEGKEVRGGNGYSTAVQITDLGVQLKLDHHQKERDQDYFFLDLVAGDMVHGTLRTGDFSISLYQEKFNSAGGEILIHGPDKTSLGRFLETEKINSKIESDFFAAQSGRYYFLVGNSHSSNYNNIHKDHFFFSFNVSRKGDLDTDSDAGNTNETALPIVPGKYQKNFGGMADREDRFKLVAKKGEKYSVEMIPQREKSPSLSIKVRDELKISIPVQSRGGNSGQGIKASFEIPEDGNYYLVIDYAAYGLGDYSDYIIELKLNG
jgi:hypothetical protein